MRLNPAVDWLFVCGPETTDDNEFVGDEFSGNEFEGKERVDVLFPLEMSSERRTYMIPIIQNEG